MTPRRRISRADAPRGTGTIVGSPTPDEHGCVRFDVQIGDEVVAGVASPCGFGLQNGVGSADAVICNAVMVAVSQFVETHADEMLPLYRDAARLRRHAGNPPLAGNTRRGKLTVSELGITKCAGGARLVAIGVAAPITIMLFTEGGWIDHTDGSDGVSDEDRDEAFTVCLDYVFAHPERAAGAGLDLGLLDELWR